MQQLRNRIERTWNNATVYIVGGGPSLLGFDWEQLRGKKIIALNRAFEVLPWADVLYWSDKVFYLWYKQQIDAFAGLKVTSLPQHNASSSIIVLKGLEYAGIVTDPEYLCRGHNSGAAAINLAVHLGASRIFLLGFDMKATESSHWHDGYKKFGVSTPPWAYLTMKRDFMQIKKVIEQKRLQLTIINANMESMLDVFPRCTPEEAILDREQ